ncbi:hypothetical protein KAW65_01480 [candidate division WOR-3 bacterium]|nr:hypothetical protein [candidate division WOR-3 bacterium]
MRRFVAIFSVAFLWSTALLATTAEEYLGEGENAFEKADYDSAIQYYTKAIELDSLDAKLYLWRGFAYTRKSQFLEAKQDFENVIELNPEGDEGMSAKIRLVALDEAEKLKKEVAKQPSEEKQKIIHSLEQLPPDELECAQVLQMIAEYHEKAEKLDKSAQYYDLAGYTYKQAENHIKAAQVLDKAGQIYGNIGKVDYAAWRYGYAANEYLVVEKYIEAAEAFVKAGERFKEIDDIYRASNMYYAAGDAYYDAGDDDKALEMYAKAADLYEPRD